jgi:hypothetical protein
MKYLFTFSVTFLLNNFPYSSEIFAQGCCTVGTSTFGGVERGVTRQGVLITALGFYVNQLDNTFESSTLIHDPFNRTAKVSLLNLEIEYGLSERISLLLVANYSIRERNISVRNSTNNSIDKVEFKSDGFGDLIFLGKYEIIRATITEPFSFSLGGGAKLPTGSYTNENNGTRLSIDLQPGTGAIDLLYWMYFYKGFPEINIGLSSNILYRYAGANFDGYKFGDEFLLTVATEYSIAEYLGLSFLTKVRFAEKDFLNNRFLPSTGGSYFDLLPGVNYYENNLSLRFFYQLPVYRNVGGIQLVTSNIIGTEIKYAFDFNSF